MRGVTIKDTTVAGRSRRLSFDLWDIVRLFLDQARKLTWIASEVDCMGRLAEELHRRADQGAEMSGEEFLKFAEGIYQTVDGRFCGFSSDRAKPWVTIYAVDSSCFDVWTEDHSLIAKLKERFQEVVDIEDRHH